MPLVKVDYSSIKIAFNNIIENSIKYSSEDSPILIRIKYASSADPLLEISFEDHGRGIDPEDLPCIFDPFFRGKNSEDQRTPGSGIGLSLVNDIIKKHGGKVEVKSKRHKGTTIKLGADDYLTNPFEMIELLARIEALLRRNNNNGKQQNFSEKGFGFADVYVDFEGADVFKNGQKMELLAQEYRLLRYLIENRGKTVSREDLLSDVWDYNSAPTTRTVDVHIAWLRQKLEPNPKHPQYIITVHKLGYKFTG